MTEKKQQPQYTFCGEVAHVIFKNEDTGATICRVSITNRGTLSKEHFPNSEITVTGYYLARDMVEHDFTIEEVFKAKYGWQGRCIRVADRKVTGRDRLVDYMIMIKVGIGKVTANHIYDTFGDESFEVLQNRPLDLMQVRGIGKKTLSKIVVNLQERKNYLPVYDALSPYGFKPAQCRKISEHFKTAAETIVKTDPYRLLEVSGIRWDLVDAYAMQNGFPKDSDSRIRAAVMETLFRTETNGNCGEDASLMSGKIRRLLGGVPMKRINEVAADMHENGEIKVCSLSGTRLVYRSEMAEKEMTVARAAALMGMTLTDSSDKTEKYIKEVEEETGFNYTERQKDACRMVLGHRFSILTGGPGTGKTATEKLIVSVFKKLNDHASFCMLAPTGKAAKCMSRSTGLDAQTIDARLQIREDMSFDGDTITDTLCIVDEASMLDIYKASVLFSAIGEDTRLLFVGDIDQLPSVGAGQILNDLIASGIPTTRLDVIQRQKGADGKTIIENDAKINAGKFDLAADDTFQFVRAAGEQDAADRIIRTYLDCVSRYGADETVCLAPTKKQDFTGVYALNRAIQAIVNPEDITKKEIPFMDGKFREGDRVINVHNDYDKAVINGDVGVIVDCGMVDGAKYVTVDYDGRQVTYTGYDDLAEIMLAYCMTIHKSQGSEYKAVIICMTDAVPRCMRKRNLLYTACSRAKKFVSLIGSPKATADCIATTDTAKRFTSLKELVKYQQKEIDNIFAA